MDIQYVYDLIGTGLFSAITVGIASYHWGKKNMFLVVANRNRKMGADPYYVHTEIDCTKLKKGIKKHAKAFGLKESYQDIQDGEAPLLFTAGEILRAMDRAKENPEDYFNL
jgi:hypothetical protein